jgi:hypothetical protein
MVRSTVEGDLVVTETLYVQTGLNIPAGSVGNTEMAAAAGILASKAQQRRPRSFTSCMERPAR